MRFAVVGVVAVSAVVVWWLVGAATSNPPEAAIPPTTAAAGETGGGSIQQADGRASSDSSTAPPVLGEAPPLVDIERWLQSDVTSLDELRGNVVVVQFWTFACRNCKNTLPHLRELAAAHSGEPFEIVGIHAPEFEFERDPEAIQRAADELGVTWPIALDTERRTFREWQGSPAYWPRTYVLDAQGNVRFDHIGEGAYDELFSVVETLLDAT